MQNRTAHDRVEHTFRIGQRIGILDLILNIWRGSIGPGDLGEALEKRQLRRVRSRVRQLPSKIASATSQLEHSHPGFKMTAEHL